jgi:hypothetical protein
MTNAEQITALDAQIAELERARGRSVDPSERARLEAQIASLEETQQALEDAEINSHFPPAGTAAGT